VFARVLQGVPQFRDSVLWLDRRPVPPSQYFLRDSQADHHRWRVARDSGGRKRLHHHTVYRRWHRATCPHVQAMTTGTPKWFAATNGELTGYLQQRITQHDTAKLIEACPNCVTD
jgi:hypothetical protein